MEDDARLGSIIQKGIQGDLVLIGFPHQHGYPRGTCSLQDAPDCMRRFINKVGPIYNPQYQIKVTKSISDYGNIILADKQIDNMQLGQLLQKLKSRCKMVTDKNHLFFVLGGHQQIFSVMEQSICLNQQLLNIDSQIEQIVPFPKPRYKSTYQIQKLITQSKYKTICINLKILKKQAFPGSEGSKNKGAQSVEVLQWMMLIGKYKLNVAVQGFDPRHQDYISGIYVCNMLYAMLLGYSNQ